MEEEAKIGKTEILIKEGAKMGYLGSFLHKNPYQYGYLGASTMERSRMLSIANTRAS
jgi:hypothetical protein